MKNLLLLTALFLSVLTTSAQTLTEKNLTTGGAATFGESNFKRAPKRVYIASFRVNFNVTASNTSSTVKSKTSMTVALAGVDAPDFQKITDDTYNMFVEDLKSKGFEIITAEEAAKTEYYADWTTKEGGTLSSAQIRGFVSATPTGFKYLIKKETGKGKEKTTFVDTSPKLSRELGAATVMNIEFSFPLFEMDESSSNYLNISSVSAKIKFEMTGVTRIVSSEKFGKDGTIYVAPKGGNIKIEAPVFKEKKLREQAVAVQNPFGYMQFVSDIDRNVTHTVVADHDLYVGEATRLLKEYSRVSLDLFYSHTLK